MQADHSCVDSERQPLRSVLRNEVGAAVCGQVLVGGIAVLVLRMWTWRPHVPSSDFGDAVISMAVIKNVSLTGWYTTSEFLGAPYGQNLLDFPAVGDFLHLCLLWVMVMVWDSPALILNLFYVISFFTVFLGAYVGSRLIGLSRSSSVVVGVLYTFLPFHLVYGPGHLFLTSYGAVPLWAALAVRQMGDRPLVQEIPSLRPSSWVTWIRRPSHLGATVVVLLGATTGLYFAVFMLLVLTVAGATGLLVQRERGRTAGTALLGVLGTLILAVQFVPTLVHQAKYGSNAEILVRGLRNLEYYSLKLSDLLLPIDGHRIPFFSNLSETSAEVVLLGERNASLGLVGSIGFVTLIAVAVVRLLQGRPGGRGGVLAVLVGSTFLVATVGGLTMVVGTLGFTYLRAWGRTVVLIAFCSLVAVGIGLDRLADKRGRRMQVGVALLVIAIGVLDSTPSKPRDDPDEIAAAWASDLAFVEEVEQLFDPGSMVFQLPVMPFPESVPVRQMSDYDHLRGYLHSESLYWSYGGVKGRAADWQQRLALLPTEAVVIAVAEAGFAALWVDRHGYPPRLSGLPEILGSPELVSEDGRLALYDLRPIAQAQVADLGEEEVRRRAAMLMEPVMWSLGSGFFGLEHDNDRIFAWASETAEIEVRNPTGGDREIVLSFVAASGVAGDWKLEIRGAGRTSYKDLNLGGELVELTIVVSPGVNRLELLANSPRLEVEDSRDLVFRIFDPRVVASP